MADQLTTSAEGLRLFFTDDIYLIRGDENVELAGQPVGVSAEQIAVIPESQPIVMPASEPAAKAAEPSVVMPAGQPVSLPVPEAVAAPVSMPAKEAVIPAAFKYLGKNQKNVLILVNDTQNEVSTEKGRELLRNIVKALQLTANDFALLNYTSCAQAQFAALSAFFSSKLVLSFGVSASQLGLDEKPQNTIIMQEQIQLVFSRELDLLADDQNEKKALWGSLKKIQL